MEQAIEMLNRFYEITAIRVAAIIVGSVLSAYLARYIFTKGIMTLSKKTKSEVDDQIVEALQRPVMYSFILAGLAWTALALDLGTSARYVALSSVKFVAVLIWTGAFMKVSGILLGALSRQVDKFTWIQDKTLPLFEILAKVAVVGGGLYFALVAWDINVTSWLASAGIVGIAIGFAAKDTLANLFSGVFILADTPYKLGDFIILDNGVRGVVTDIGIRSTRLLTRDDVQVILPNAVIANSKIINETGGPYQKMRVKARLGVAYGSDVDRVREILTGCAAGIEHISKEPAPRARFYEFGDSGLIFEVQAWIEEPVYRGRVIDKLNTNIYNALNAAGIEIPYAKQDVYIKQMPAGGDRGSEKAA